MSHSIKRLPKSPITAIANAINDCRITVPGMLSIDGPTQLLAILKIGYVANPNIAFIINMQLKYNVASVDNPYKIPPPIYFAFLLDRECAIEHTIPPISERPAAMIPIIIFVLNINRLLSNQVVYE
jgi:hypothetical protein